MKGILIITGIMNFLLEVIFILEDLETTLRD